MVSDVTALEETIATVSKQDPLSDSSDAKAFEIPEALAPFLEKSRFKVSKGGRGSGKSWSIARILVLIARENPNCTILCARETQISIADSVHKLLAEQISLMGYDDFFKVQKAEILGINGSRFVFKGIRHNPTEIKSMEGVLICWVEEAEKITKESLDILIPTIRLPGSEIWFSFNPRNQSDPIYQRFIVNTPPNCTVVTMNWRDNPWFPNVLKEEMEYDRNTDFSKYLHIWEGKTREEAGESVFKPEWDQEWKPEIHEAQGMNILILVDPANAQHDKADYTVFTVLGLNKDKGIYIFEWARDRMDIFDRVNKVFELVQKYADYSRPVVYWETPAMSDDTVHVRARQAEIGYRFPVYGIKPRGKKEDRISGLIPYFANMQIFLPIKQMYRQKDGKVIDLVKAFKHEKDAFPSIPGSVHDDMIDCLAHLTYTEVPKVFPNSIQSRSLAGKSLTKRKTFSIMDFPDDKELDKLFQ